MGFRCGIIGLPNVGKSTIFNALSGAGATVANYPFCTIDPNRAKVPVPDEKLLKIGDLLDKKKLIPASMEFVDVAGLVKGASRGEGLGNKFLDNIRNVDALLHVVRNFYNDDIVHVEGKVDPLDDIDIINTELILSDIATLDTYIEKQRKQTRSAKAGAFDKAAAAEDLIAHLNQGNFLSDISIEDAFQDVLTECELITVKPVLYVVNSDEDDSADKNDSLLKTISQKHNSEVLTISGKIEEEIAVLPLEEKSEFIEAMGLSQSGLDRLIIKGYKLLDLLSYYTVATDAQAWSLKNGTPALKAAGKIHSDFERGFIRAEVMKYNDLIDAGSELEVRNRGLLRSEGKEYIIEEGDIVKYLFNV